MGRAHTPSTAHGRGVLAGEQLMADRLVEPIARALRQHEVKVLDMLGPSWERLVEAEREPYLTRAREIVEGAV